MAQPTRESGYLYQGSAEHTVSEPEHASPLGSRGITTPRRELLSDVFEHFPYGIVVVDPAHRIVASNRAAAALVTLPPDVRGPGTCCDLFGCGRADTPLEGACLTEIAITTGERLPDVFLEPPCAPGGPVWVTAAPLSTDTSRIIFQIRPARVGDRPASADAQWVGQPHLKVHALGRLHLTTWNGALNGEWLGQRAGQLFKFLLTERHHFVPLEMIAEAVWPHANNNTGNTVRHCMHILRSKLEPDPSRRDRSAFVLAKNGCYRLNPDAVSVDADEFERVCSAGMRSFADGDSATAISRFEAAVAMYGGDYLADDRYSEWAFGERERLRELVTIPLRALAERRSDDPDAAIGYLKRLAEMEPFDNEIQRQLLVQLVKQGRRSRAVRQYHAFQVRLLRAFNDKPTFDLAEIVAQRSHRDH
jgi:DNA-binding SARP family transcriptional activator